MTSPRPERLYVWLVPSEEVLDQPGSWRIRKWDTEPFPEATFVLSESGEREHFPPCPPCGTPDTCFAQRWCMDTGHPVNAARVPEDRKARDGGALPTVSTPAAAPSSSDKLDYARLKIGEPCYRCGKVISAPLSHLCRTVTPSHVGSLSEFVHAPKEVREAIGNDVAKKAIERQQATLTASSTAPSKELVRWAVECIQAKYDFFESSEHGMNLARLRSYAHE